MKLVDLWRGLLAQATGEVEALEKERGQMVQELASALRGRADMEHEKEPRKPA